MPMASAISSLCLALIAPSAIGFAAEHVGYRATYFVLALLLLVVAALAGRVAAADRIGAAAHP
jgi:hypothetical protein